MAKFQSRSSTFIRIIGPLVSELSKDDVLN